jgi:ubiquilin
VVLPATPPPSFAVPGSQVANQEPTPAAPASFPAAGLGGLLQDLGCYRATANRGVLSLFGSGTSMVVRIICVQHIYTMS